MLVSKSNEGDLLYTGSLIVHNHVSQCLRSNSQLRQLQEEADEHGERTNRHKLSCWHGKTYRISTFCRYRLTARILEFITGGRLTLPS